MKSKTILTLSKLTNKSLFASFASVSTRAKAFKSIFIKIDITFSSVLTWIWFTVINLKVKGNYQ